jgi:two-component system phosphate regulon response regulator PhoB
MGLQKHVLVVDDEKDLCELLVYNLTKAGYETSVAHNGRQALDAVAKRTPDLILLDVMLPELSGTEVASRVRTNPATAQVPIMMLTAKGEEVDQIVGLTVGADDYVVKPFSVKVLVARVEALLRRTQRTPDNSRRLALGPIEIDADTHEVFLDGQSIKLTLTEFRLLASLVQAGSRVLSRATLMAKAMGPGVTVTERTIDVHITSIRKKLGVHANIIKTIRGVGYKATLDQEDADSPETQSAL